MWSIVNQSWTELYFDICNEGSEIFKNHFLSDFSNEK